MSEDEDLYCNPQSNVFLQARLQKKPPKKVNEKKGMFGRKPTPPPGKKPEKLRPAIPGSASAELGSLFKSGLTRPSELRKNVIPEKQVDTSEEMDENHVIDFRARLRPVPSPIKTEDENSRCSVTSETDIPPPPPHVLENDDEVDNERPQIKSPPVPKRTSTLTARRPVPIPTPTNNGSVSEQDTLQSDIEQTPKQHETKLREVSDLPDTLPDPPHIGDYVKDIVTSRPKRRLLQKPSKAPVIPLNTFPVIVSIKSITLPDYIPEDTYPQGDCEEMYTENELPPPEEDCEEMYTENELPPPEEDCEEMYTENELPPPALPTTPSLYDAPRTPLLSRPPDRATVYPAEEQIEDEDEELYTDEVSDYPSFRQVTQLTVVEPSRPPVPQYNVDEEEEEDIYDDAEFPLIVETYPVDEYRTELEECEDIYDDIGNYNVATSVESPVPVRAHPSPMAGRHNPAPPSALPPPPQLPISAPPPAAPVNKQKQKGGLFGIFKKSKKKSAVDSQVSVELSVEESPVEEVQPSKHPTDEEDDDELYIDGEGCGYSDDDDEPIYEDQ